LNNNRNILSGIGFAVIACFIWSGNFIVARAFAGAIPPVAMSLLRWSVATMVLFPFAYRHIKAEKAIILQHKTYFFWISLLGITFFNTFLYLAGRTTTAINMALIGTCSSPIFSVIFAAIFLKEKVSPLRITGMAIMIAGILFLLIQGSWQMLVNFHFTTGDLWVLAAALFFAGYNILVRKKPAGLSPLSFLFSTFFSGTVLLIPFYVWELQHAAPIEWSAGLVWSVLYLGIGTSVIAFMLWNAAISRLGAARTALFGNLIPLFSSVEAVFLLNESVNRFHFISAFLIINGLLIANLRKS